MFLKILYQIHVYDAITIYYGFDLLSMYEITMKRGIQ